VNPGVNTELFKPDAGVLTGNTVLSVGALSEFKGHDLAIKAVGMIPSPERPDLVIVGDRGSQAYGASLSAMAESAGVSARVVKGISDLELVDLYRSSRAVICAQRNEPYGLVPLESMACGTPVVAVDQGGFPGNIRDGVTGFLVPRKAENIAESLAKLLDDRALADSMGIEGRRFIELERSSTGESEQMLNIIRSTASRCMTP